MTALPRPTADEHDPYYARYIARVTDDDVLSVLDGQRSTIAALGRLDATTAAHRYGPDKWTVTEVLGHLSDAERVFAYRGMRFVRQDGTDLPGFDENHYVPAGRFTSRPITDVAGELAAGRAASLALFRSFDAESAAFRGVANGAPCSARAIPWIVAGHFDHHVAILRDRYGIAV